MSPETMAPPESFDLCKADVPIFNLEVVDQGACNCCCAITASVAASALYNSNHEKSKHVEASPQELIDCVHEKIPHKDQNKEPDSMGCLTSSVSNGFRYMAEYGLALEKDYPFEAKRAKCRTDEILEKSPKAPRLWVTGHERALGKKKEQILEVIKKRPIASALEITRELMMFHGTGIFDGSFVTEEDKIEAEKRFKDWKPVLDEKGKPKKKIYHAILIVGYGVDPNGVEYLKIKNSWGTGWGDKGYAKVACKLFSKLHTYWPTGEHLRRGKE